LIIRLTTVQSDDKELSLGLIAALLVLFGFTSAFVYGFNLYRWRGQENLAMRVKVRNDFFVVSGALLIMWLCEMFWNRQYDLNTAAFYPALWMVASATFFSFGRNLSRIWRRGWRKWASERSFEANWTQLGWALLFAVILIGGHSARETSLAKFQTTILRGLERTPASLNN
jgi:hypothetical protein